MEKSLNFSELVSFSDWLFGRLQDAQLQELWTDGEILVFQFYRREEIYILVDTRGANPRLWLRQQKPVVKKQPKPVSVFLASHARGLKLIASEILADEGRVLRWTFGNHQKRCELDFYLIPKNFNIQVRSEGKSIYWARPRPLAMNSVLEFEKVDRDWQEWCDSQDLRFESRDAAHVSGGAQKKSTGVLSKALEKKEKAIATLRQQLENREEDFWRTLGHKLNSEQELTDLEVEKVGLTSSRFESRDKAFEKARQIEKKRDGTLKRISLLEEEIREIRNRLVADSSEAPVQSAFVAKDTKVKVEGVRSRKVDLPEGLRAYIGHSGADNLKLLRQARGWDYWIHLKDEPGAHAILFRNKGQGVSSDAIEIVARAVWEHSKRGKSVLAPLKFEVLVVECRFVRPIKGDKLGRVSIQNPQVFVVASKR